jgi:hypothetical protein
MNQNLFCVLVGIWLGTALNLFAEGLWYRSGHYLFSGLIVLVVGGICLGLVKEFITD